MNICRICFNTKPGKDITQLSLQPNENGKKQSYEEIVEFCLDIQVKINTKKSTKLCETCYSKIIEFYQFKALALRNDAHLRSLELQTVVLLDDKVKKKEYNISEADVNDEIHDSDNNQEDEQLVYEDGEPEHLLSDDELLSVFEDNKENKFNSNSVKDNKEDLDEKGLPKTEKPKNKGGRPKKVRRGKIQACEICGKEFSGAGMKKHRRLHKLPIIYARKPFKCDKCDSTFTAKSSMKTHIEMKHCNIITKECHICGKSVKYLTRHITAVHKLEHLPMECVPCGRQFLSKADLESHLRSHAKDRPFNCEVCGKTFPTEDKMLMHRGQVHDKERSHICQFCPKRYFSKQNLHAHMRNHTKEMPYECSVCNKKFQSSNGLKTHRYLHNSEKKYKCTLCNMSFISPYYVREHMKNHTKEKNYPCQYCNARFTKSSNKYTHEYSVHLKQALTNGTILCFP